MCLGSNANEQYVYELGLRHWVIQWLAKEQCGVVSV
jgi:hypothetical protein